MDPLAAALKVASSGLGAQSERLRVVSENLANAQSTGDAPGAEPYRRKTISFAAELDRATGGSLVEVNEIGRDDSNFPVEFIPGHDAADEKGYVKMPNVNTPGYGTVDVEPFEKVLDKSGVTMAATQAGHLTGRATEAGFAVREEERDAALLPSENSVVLENELLKAGDIRRQFELNTAIVKAFHRMLMMSSKS